MESMPRNPFKPVEVWTDTSVKVKDNENDEPRMVDAKHYHIRYVVGESHDKRFIDDGSSKVDAMEEISMYVVDSIHRLEGEAFHYDVGMVEKIVSNINSAKDLRRIDTCEEHELVEITYESPGVECCPMTKDEADKQTVPLQYISGYLLGKSEDLYKVALAKTVLDSGKEIYEGIRIIPKAVIKSVDCLSE
jgi:hypothetical protein